MRQLRTLLVVQARALAREREGVDVPEERPDRAFATAMRALVELTWTASPPSWIERKRTPTTPRVVAQSLRHTSPNGRDIQAIQLSRCPAELCGDESLAELIVANGIATGPLKPEIEVFIPFGNGLARFHRPTVDTITTKAWDDMRAVLMVRVRRALDLIYPDGIPFPPMVFFALAPLLHERNRVWHRDGTASIDPSILASSTYLFE